MHSVARSAGASRAGPDGPVRRENELRVQPAPKRPRPAAEPLNDARGEDLYSRRIVSAGRDTRDSPADDPMGADGIGIATSGGCRYIRTSLPQNKEGQHADRASALQLGCSQNQRAGPRRGPRRYPQASPAGTQAWPIGRAGASGAAAPVESNRSRGDRAEHGNDGSVLRGRSRSRSACRRGSGTAGNAGELPA